MASGPIPALDQAKPSPILPANHALSQKAGSKHAPKHKPLSKSKGNVSVSVSVRPSITFGNSPNYQDLVEFAKYIQIDPTDDTELLWIAWEAMMAPLPAAWEMHEDEHGAYYYDTKSLKKSRFHPQDEYFRTLAKRWKAQKTSSKRCRPPTPARRVRRTHKRFPQGGSDALRALLPGLSYPLPAVPAFQPKPPRSWEVDLSGVCGSEKFPWTCGKIYSCDDFGVEEIARMADFLRVPLKPVGDATAVYLRGPRGSTLKEVCKVAMMAGVPSSRLKHAATEDEGATHRAGHYGLAWVARLALSQPLPSNYDEVDDSQGGVFFFHKTRKAAVPYHPLDSLFRMMAKLETRWNDSTALVDCRQWMEYSVTGHPGKLYYNLLTGASINARPHGLIQTREFVEWMFKRRLPLVVNHCATLIQALFRRYTARRIGIHRAAEIYHTRLQREKQEQQMQLHALKIQTTWRGFQTRKRLLLERNWVPPSMRGVGLAPSEASQDRLSEVGRDPLVVDWRKRNLAAYRIQRAWAWYQQRRELKEAVLTSWVAAFQVRRRAAIRIQRWFTVILRQRKLRTCRRRIWDTHRLRLDLQLHHLSGIETRRQSLASESRSRPSSGNSLRFGNVNLRNSRIAAAHSMPSGSDLVDIILDNREARLEHQREMRVAALRAEVYSEREGAPSNRPHSAHPISNRGAGAGADRGARPKSADAISAMRRELESSVPVDAIEERVSDDEGSVAEHDGEVATGEGVATADTKNEAADEGATADNVGAGADDSKSTGRRLSCDSAGAGDGGAPHDEGSMAALRASPKSEGSDHHSPVDVDSGADEAVGGSTDGSPGEAAEAVGEGLGSIVEEADGSVNDDADKSANSSPVAAASEEIALKPSWRMRTTVVHTAACVIQLAFWKLLLHKYEFRKVHEWDARIRQTHVVQEKKLVMLVEARDKAKRVDALIVSLRCDLPEPIMEDPSEVSSVAAVEAVAEVPRSVFPKPLNYEALEAARRRRILEVEERKKKKMEAETHAAAKSRVHAYETEEAARLIQRTYRRYRTLIYDEMRRRMAATFEGEWHARAGVRRRLRFEKRRTHYAQRVQDAVVAIQRMARGYIIRARAHPKIPRRRPQEPQKPTPKPIVKRRPKPVVPAPPPVQDNQDLSTDALSPSGERRTSLMDEAGSVHSPPHAAVDKGPSSSGSPSRTASAGASELVAAAEVEYEEYVEGHVEPTKEEMDVYQRSMRIHNFKYSRNQPVAVWTWPRQRKELYARRHGGARKFQTAWRTYLDRPTLVAQRRRRAARRLVLWARRCLYARRYYRVAAWCMYYVQSCMDAILTIQRFWRGKMGRDRFRERKREHIEQSGAATKISRFLRTKKFRQDREIAVVKLQASYRGRLGRKAAAKKRQELAATKIQTVMRGYLTRTGLQRTQRSRAVVVIQRWYRACQKYREDMKVVDDLYVEFASVIETQAATRIQSWFRMYLNRRRFVRVLARTLRLQRKYRQRWRERKTNAGKIQMWFRKKRENTVRLSMEAEAAMDVQKVYRGFVGRSVANRLRLETRWAILLSGVDRRGAAVAIQSLWRGALARDYVNRLRWSRHMNDSAAKIQRAFRKYRQWLYRSAYEYHQLRNDAARTLQQAFRSYSQKRKRLMEINDLLFAQASTVIQSAIRGYIARRRAGVIRRTLAIERLMALLEPLVLGMKARRAVRVLREDRLRARKAVVIQRHYRGMLIRVRFREVVRLAQEQATAICIQKLYRGWNSRRRVQTMREQIKKERVALYLQSLYRMWVAKQRFKMLRSERDELYYAIFVQKHIRGRIGRKLAHFKRSQQIVARRKQVAAVKIQTVFRGYIGRKNFRHLLHLYRLQCASRFLVPINDRPAPAGEGVRAAGGVDREVSRVSLVSQVSQRSRRSAKPKPAVIVETKDLSDRVVRQKIKSEAQAFALGVGALLGDQAKVQLPPVVAPRPVPGVPSYHDASVQPVCQRVGVKELMPEPSAETVALIEQPSFLELDMAEGSHNVVSQEEITRYHRGREVPVLVQYRNEVSEAEHKPTRTSRLRRHPLAPLGDERRQMPRGLTKEQTQKYLEMFAAGKIGLDETVCVQCASLHQEDGGVGTARSGPESVRSADDEVPTLLWSPKKVRPRTCDHVHHPRFVRHDELNDILPRFTASGSSTRASTATPGMRGESGDDGPGRGSRDAPRPGSTPAVLPSNARPAHNGFGHGFDGDMSYEMPPLRPHEGFQASGGGLSAIRSMRAHR
eukprot:Rmarinus@m.28889